MERGLLFCLHQKSTALPPGFFGCSQPEWRAAAPRPSVPLIVGIFGRHPLFGFRFARRLVALLLAQEKSTLPITQREILTRYPCCCQHHLLFRFMLNFLGSLLKLPNAVTNASYCLKRHSLVPSVIGLIIRTRHRRFNRATLKSVTGPAN